MNANTLYPIKIDGEVYEVPRSAISGSELIEIAGKEPAGDFVVYLLMENGDMESIREQEVVDLQRVGLEKFLTFRTDVIYRLEVDGKPREWASSFVTGLVIKRLAGIEDIAHVGVWQRTAEGTKAFISDCAQVDLSTHGIEKFWIGARYSICIEGAEVEWFRETITTEELIQLGGWDASQGAVEVDKDQNERSLSSGEVISLLPGLSFCKKQRFRRGFNPNSRIGKELLLLRKNFPQVEYKEVDTLHWFKIDGYPLPPPLSPEVISVVFFVTAGHPVPKPYGFYVPTGIMLGSQILNLNNPPHSPPFEGGWRFVSWDVENWRPGTDVKSGDNLWGWVRSFRNRLLEGE